jgi:glucokinase
MRRAGAAGTVGCDIGGSNIKLLLLRGGRLSRRQSVPCPTSCGQKEIIDRLVELLRPLPATSAGIALPGFLDENRRKILRLSNLPQLDGLDLAARLERRLKWNIVLEADSNAGAVGEARLGNGRGIKRLLYVTVGTGLGAALTLAGDPVRVSNHTVGHIAGIAIGKGKTREAEKLLSAGGIMRRFRGRGGRPSRAGTRNLFELAREGDQAARETWKETGELLAELLAILVQMLRPEGIIIGGGVAGAAECFLPAARRALRRHLRSYEPGCPEIRPAGLETYAGAAGAALCARKVLS